MQAKSGGKLHLKLNIGERPIANKYFITSDTNRQYFSEATRLLGFQLEVQPLTGD